MRLEPPIKSKSLQGVSDLTLAAPIRRGLIPALDARSYESRLRLLLKALGSLRSATREVEPVRLFSDAVERIRSIHSFRLAILETEPRQLLLAVTFDSAWEPYMRRIWRDLGPLLDVIFCNCDGYITAHDHSFAEYSRWVRSGQVATEFFYNASALTVDDLHYLRKAEELRRNEPPATSDALACRLQIDEPAKLAGTRAAGHPDLVLRALAAVYRLADMYPPDSADGGILLRAAHGLLRELEHDTVRTAVRASPAAPRYRAALDWFYGYSSPSRPKSPIEEFDRHDVQGGIVTPYPGMTHGCLLLIELDGPGAAQALLKRLRLDVTAEGAALPSDGIVVNVGFTFEGLRVAGLSRPSLDEFPPEFREGMEARAGLLGDFGDNHPSKWLLPERNWPAAAAGGVERVELSTVHVIVQLACACAPRPGDHAIAGNAGHPLHSKAAQLVAGLDGVTLLSVQAMRRHVDKGIGLPRDHFGFIDGISQPALDAPATGGNWRDRIELGDLLLGYTNTLADPPAENPLWKNGSFLVIRKLKQDVGALDAMLQRACKATGLSADAIKARMMGRTVDGDALADPGRTRSNDFDYSGDATGSLCPFQAHVRRANPRTRPGPDRPPVPRIVRRGMSYGPPAGSGDDERGLIFMAYNASIAEQFEVIQRWVSGGNSTDSYSALRDPFLGAANDGDPQTFAFEDNGRVVRVDLRSARPFVKLQWGAYVFVPSVAALDELYEIAAAAKEDSPPVNWSASRGAALIARLLAAEPKVGFETAATLWKTTLEDISARMSGISASVWAAVREPHNGALRTPYGVLVGTKALVMEVLQNGGGRYTASGYAQRMRRSFGEIYLGLDAGTEYDRQSAKANEAIGRIGYKAAFDLACAETKAVLSKFIAVAKLGASGGEWEVTVDIKEIADPVLAQISKAWFGLPDDKFVEAAGWDWNWNPQLDAPRCPGHFLAPSRYMFQPNPGPEASRYGEAHGQALATAVRRFVNAHRHAGTAPSAPLAAAIFAAFPNDNDLVARTLIGVMMGFLPTVDGNLRACLFEWINDRSLWDHQLAYLASSTTEPCERAEQVLLAPLMRTMQLRPVPELIWRVVLERHRLGGVDLMPGDKVVVSLVSATQQDLAEGIADIYPVFGGDRSKDPHPTHACPGYRAAMGVLLGTIAALLESATLRPTPAALTLSLTGTQH